MNNEVAKLFDDLFLDFIEERGLQIWPERRNARPYAWTIQCPNPFIQVTHDNLKGALTKMAAKLGDLRFKA